MKSKKGIQLGQAFGAVLALVLVAVLVVIAIYLFGTLGDSVRGTSSCVASSACNATTAMVTQFAQYPTLVGLVGTIIFLALVIGVLVGAFALGGRKGM